MAKTLSQLFKKLSTTDLIEELSSDSRTKTTNGLYFALEGLTVDGHDFIDQAIRNGAVAIVHSKEVRKRIGIHYIKVKDVRATMHDISSKYYDYPERRLQIFGITGTNGKTTVAKTLHNLIPDSGYIGTISVEYGDYHKESILTTPDTLELKKIYADMVEAGILYVFQEVSSQGLALRRVLPEYYDVVAFTNLSQDHLDYHNTMEEYFEAKSTLFTKGATIFINDEDPYGAMLAHTYESFVCGQEDYHQYKIENLVAASDHTSFDIIHDGQATSINTSYIGSFNAHNLSLIFMILKEYFGLDDEFIAQSLKDLQPISGRMNVIQNNPTVVVDFAHTPASVKATLNHFRAVLDKNNKGGRLFTVFGSAGRRDALKRPILGKIITEISDETYFSEDDPRDEDLMDIVIDMTKELTNHKWTFIPHRKAAIEYALSQATEQDIVALLGKGSDTFMYRYNGRQPYEGDESIVRNYKERVNAIL